VRCVGALHSTSRPIPKKESENQHRQLIPGEMTSGEFEIG